MVLEYLWAEFYRETASLSLIRKFRVVNRKPRQDPAALAQDAELMREDNQARTIELSIRVKKKPQSKHQNRMIRHR